MTEFSDRLKQVRLERKLTHQQTAERQGVCRTTYHRLETGKFALSHAYLTAIIKAVGVSSFSNEKEKTPPLSDQR